MSCTVLPQYRIHNFLREVGIHSVTAPQQVFPHLYPGIVLWNEKSFRCPMRSFPHPKFGYMGRPVFKPFAFYKKFVFFSNVTAYECCIAIVTVCLQHCPAPQWPALLVCSKERCPRTLARIFLKTGRTAPPRGGTEGSSQPAEGSPAACFTPFPGSPLSLWTSI